MTVQNYGFRLFAIGVVCSLAFAAAAHLYIFDASDDAVGRSMRNDIAWTGMNGRIEAAQLERYMARFSTLGSKNDEKAVRLFYDILRSRMKTWGSGGFRKFIESSPRRLVQFEALRARVEGLGSDIEQLNQAEAQRRILAALSEMAPVIDRIGAEAHTTSIREAAVISRDLRYQQQLQRWLVIALLASGASVLGFTALQNRSLRAAQIAAARHTKKLLFLSQHDALTKLPNRRAFEAAYQTALRAKRTDERILVAAIDLDGFKLVNDLLGHAAGDAVLVAVAKLLASEATSADPRNVVCRVGGDEFLALLWKSDNQTANMEFAERILSMLAHPVETGYGTMMIGASVGVAASDVTAANDLIVNADLALTEAKTRGKGIALAFEPGMLAGLKRRLRLESDLGKALSRGEIEAHYQPKIDLASKRMAGLEALVRWRHPEFGWVSPEEFIPIAESNGDIVKIGRLMLETACRDAAAIPADVGISVNLSVVQILKDDIIATVKDVLASTGLANGRLTLEVTESVMMTDPEKVLEALKQLKVLGVRVSLDDFGTGYSALSYLTQFSWDELKIDRSFIGRAWCDPINVTIIKAVKMLAQQMNAKLTIEGVETVEQYDLLCQIGCDTVQGYLFGRPAPLSALQPILLRDLAAAFADSDAKPSSSKHALRSNLSIK